ncbi:O-fucosyltransferase 30 [Bienertia sinuspersici]
MNNGARTWKPKKHSNPIFMSLSFLIVFFIFFVFYQEISTFILPHSTISISSQFPQCAVKSVEKFLWYAPHSGFSNQLSEFKNAILMAAILNRTLIVPPVLDHHAVALGSCPKFRVLDPNEIRLKVWDHVIDLVSEGRYVSMARIIDLSSVASLVQTIDFRRFVSQWCGVDLNSICSTDSSIQRSSLNNLRKCGSLLSGFQGNVDKCLHAVNVDCRTKVWTYQENALDGALDSFQPDEQLKMKKKFSYVRYRQDVYKNLGPGSEAHLSTVLAFGSLFSSQYKGSQLYIDIDIKKLPRNHEMQSLFGKIEFMPFVPDIIEAGKEFVQKNIGAPFLCTQLRLLDGQFKSHWKPTFSVLKQKVEVVKKGSSHPIHIFVMTDLPRSNWSSCYLGELANKTSSFKLHVLSDGEELVKRTAAKVGAAYDGSKDSHCPHQLPNVLLFVEETVCSCASLGFVGTAGSTIAENIELMRKNNVCVDNYEIGV